MIQKLETPLTELKVKSLNVGDIVSLTGEIYTARDAAHKKLALLIEEGKDLPFDLKDQIIYYVGPTPPRPGSVMGSCGPTTATRMDAYSPLLLRLGLKGMIGKGYRSREVVEEIQKQNAVYFGAIGGTGAKLSKCVASVQGIAFPELGTESIKKLIVKDMPLIVLIDSKGNDLYKLAGEKYFDYLKKDKK